MESTRASKRRKLSATTADEQNGPGTTVPPAGTPSGQTSSSHNITPRRRSTRAKPASSSKPAAQASPSVQSKSKPASTPESSERHNANHVADTPSKGTASARKQANGRKTPQSAGSRRRKRTVRSRGAPAEDDHEPEGEEDESDELAREELPTVKVVAEDDEEDASQRRGTAIQLGAINGRQQGDQDKGRRDGKPEAARRKKQGIENDPEPSEDDAASFRTAPSHEDDAPEPVSDLQAVPQDALSPMNAPSSYQDLPHPDESTSTPLTTLQTIALQKLAQRRRIPLVALTSERTKIHHLLHQTVAHGESNSLLLIGARGTGKTALVEDVLAELSADVSHRDDFHTIRLNGFFQTDDKLALREIWRQLGREMELDEQGQREVGGGTRNYADTLATLLALFSHTPDAAGDQVDGQEASDDAPQQQQPEIEDNAPTPNSNTQIASKSVLFILNEFDLFASRPRQTLLYNLLDIAQSQKAPIAVLGLSTRIDVAEGLEKRVKSRFSHRYVHVGGAIRNFKTFAAVCRAAVGVERGELGFRERVGVLGGGGDARSGDGDPIATWNGTVDEMLARSDIQATLTRIYHTTKSIPEALSALYLPTSLLPTTTTTAPTKPTPHPRTTPTNPLSHLPSLTTLALSLLIASARLEIILAQPLLTFPLAYDEYTNLSKRSKQRDATASGGAGGRVWGARVARAVWEGELLKGGLVVAEGGGAAEENVRCEVALEEIEGACGGGENLERGMERWCREI